MTPANELIVESSLAVTLSAPAAWISYAPGVASTSGTSAIVASTELWIQFSVTDPAPAMLLPPLPLTASAAIWASRPGGRSVGLAKVASIVMSPLSERTVDLRTAAVTLSPTSLTANPKPTAAVPFGLATMFPASVAIEAVSLALIAIEPAARTWLATWAAFAATWASTVLAILLDAIEPPKARPLDPPDPAPPTARLKSRAFSVAFTLSVPAVDRTVAPSIAAVILLLTSMTPVDRAIASDPLVEAAIAPTPTLTCEESVATTSIASAAVTCMVPLRAPGVPEFEIEAVTSART